MILIVLILLPEEMKKKGIEVILTVILFEFTFDFNAVLFHLVLSPLPIITRICPIIIINFWALKYIR